jgi:hypothetical protein
MWCPPNVLFSPVSCFIEYWITWLVTFYCSSRRHHTVSSSPCHRCSPSTWASTGLGWMMISQNTTTWVYVSGFVLTKNYCVSVGVKCKFFRNFNYGNGTEKLRPKCQDWNNVSMQGQQPTLKSKTWWWHGLTSLTLFKIMKRRKYGIY